MSISDAIQPVSVLIEAVIAIVAIAIAVGKKKMYGWLIALTFVLFVLFDVARIFALAVPEIAHSVVFLIACVSMLVAVWLIYSDTK